jgi:hypothetical protein
MQERDDMLVHINTVNLSKWSLWKSW